MNKYSLFLTFFHGRYRVSVFIFSHRIRAKNGFRYNTHFLARWTQVGNWSSDRRLESQTVRSLACLLALLVKLTENQSSWKRERDSLPVESARIAYVRALWRICAEGRREGGGWITEAIVGQERKLLTFLESFSFGEIESVKVVTIFF